MCLFFLSETQAAVLVQSMLRRRLARKRLRRVIAAITVKTWDPASAAHYYYNTLTGDSSWYKPQLLGSEDVEQYLVRACAIFTVADLQTPDL